MSAGGGFFALVAAASVTQFVQFTATVFRGQPSPPPVYSTSTPPAALRFCLLPEERAAPPYESADAGYFGDAYEREIFYGSSGFALVFGGVISVLGGLHRCCRGSQATARVNHGRAAELQNQRSGGRGRLSIAPAGVLGSIRV